MAYEHGGMIIGEVLAQRGVKTMYTLCGGHISPILVGAKRNGIRVIDVRDEVTAVFAADATARMTGVPGVAAVTAGPGVTNTITAVKNAQMAQSPVLIFGGATATILKGRGSLQDIDQLALMKPLTKFATSVKTLSKLGPTVEKALDIAESGIPGPVFVEVPVDLLYPEPMIREQFMKEAGVEHPKNIEQKALQLAIKGYLLRQFHQPHVPVPLPSPTSTLASLKKSVLAGAIPGAQVDKVAQLLARAQRPVLVMGSQSMVNCRDGDAVADAVRRLGIPTWLGGVARGLLGRYSDIQFRHKRSAALKEADLVIVAGFPFDFRLGYGRGFNSKATLVAVNLNPVELRKNRRPDVAVEMHAGEFLQQLATRFQPRDGQWQDWFSTCRDREIQRDNDIAAKSGAVETLINPLQILAKVEEAMADDAVLIVDGGDFVATASYILRPRGPLRWLDPGVFGTLGVGGGFAIGAAACYPDSEIWLIYGDGSSAYSLAEFDTCVRHGLAPIAVVGTDASWAQIAREQTEMLGDDIGTVLRRTDYHKVAEGYGGVGLLLDDHTKIDETLAEAKKVSASGKPVLINVQLAGTDFRKGSISI